MGTRTDWECACGVFLDSLDFKLELENAWPGVFLFYLKFLWAVTLHGMT